MNYYTYTPLFPALSWAINLKVNSFNTSKNWRLHGGSSSPFCASPFLRLYLMPSLWTKKAMKQWHKSLHPSHVAHSCFYECEVIISIPHPPGWDASPSEVTPRHFIRLPRQYSHTHLYSCMERGDVRVKSLSQEHNTLTPLRLEPRPLDQGPVVRRPIGANPGLNFNLGLYISLLKTVLG